MEVSMIFGLIFIIIALFFFFTRSGSLKPLLLLIPLCALCFIPIPFRIISAIRFILVFFSILLLWLFFPFSVPPGLSMFFGVPGSGKTTLASYIAKNFPGDSVYSNVPIKGTYKIDRNDIGKYDISGPGACLIVDEAGIDFNNRFGNSRSSRLSLSEEQIQWLKLYRHYKIECFCCFSQRVDIEITIRGLADRVYILRKTRFPFVVSFVGVRKVLTVDTPEGSTLGQIVDAFKIAPLDFHCVFAPPLWRMFDSFDAPALPSKDFPVWGNESKYTTQAD